MHVCNRVDAILRILWDSDTDSSDHRGGQKKGLDSNTQSCYGEWPSREYRRVAQKEIDLLIHKGAWFVSRRGAGSIGSLTTRKFSGNFGG